MLAVTLIMIFSLARAAFLPASFSADYEERFVSSTDGKEKKSFGRVDYQRPRHVRFEVVAPNPSTFVANPQTSWYYTPPFIEGEEGQVVVQKSAGLPFTRFLDALTAGAKSNAGYDAVLKGDTLTLTFKGKMKQELQLAQAVLRARGGDAAKSRRPWRLRGDEPRLWQRQESRDAVFLFQARRQVSYRAFRLCGSAED